VSSSSRSHSPATNPGIMSHAVLPIEGQPQGKCCNNPYTTRGNCDFQEETLGTAWLHMCGRSPCALEGASIALRCHQGQILPVCRWLSPALFSPAKGRIIEHVLKSCSMGSSLGSTTSP
jgi:hypothetical protein